MFNVKTGSQEEQVSSISDLSDQTKSIIMNNYSFGHPNQHYFQYFHPLDDDRETMPESNDNKHDEKIKSSSKVLSNVMSEDEHCQICGDLASGWHCG